jgi:H+/gluconate symporter-like permease
MLYLGRLNWSDCLHILSNYKQFFNEIKKSTKDYETRLKISSTRQVWELYYPLVCLTAQATVNISEEEWLTHAQEFGQAFIDVYQAEDVTTYIHIFMFHFGFFLDKYNSLEKFANYALEGKHSVIKWILAYSSSGFRYRPSETA